MDTEKVLKLVEAGFTAEEIRSMMNEQAPVSPAPAPSLPLSPEPTGAVDTAAPAEAPAEEKEEKEDAVSLAIEKALTERLDKINSGFEQMYKNMQKLAGMPSMQDIKPEGIDDIITRFFKEE